MKSLLLVLALLGQNAPGERFCEDVSQLAAGAEEADPFRSLRNRDFRPRLLRGYCFYSSAEGYTCGQTMSPPEDSKESVARRIQACLPGSQLTRNRRDFRDEFVVSSGRFQARVTEQGSDRAHVGRSVNIYVASVARGGKP